MNVTVRFARSPCCGQSNAILPADRRGNTIGIITTFRLTEAVQTEAAIILLIVGMPVASGITAFMLVQPKYYYYQKMSRADNKDPGRCVAGVPKFNEPFVNGEICSRC